MKRLLIVLVLSLSLLCACDNAQSDKERALAAARQVSNQYDFLAGGLNAIQTLPPMLSYYDSVTYDSARKSAKVSPTVINAYFPTPKWEGSDFLAESASFMIENIYISSYSDSVQNFVVEGQYMTGSAIPRTQYYAVSYSVESDWITSCTLLQSIRNY